MEESTVRPLPGDTLTARERVMRTINGEPVDRVPIFDLIQHIGLMEHITGEKATLGNGMDLLLATIRQCLDVTRGIAPPVEERTWTDEDGFVYKGEWWTTWLIERPFKTVEEVCEFIRREIDLIAETPPDSMWSFAGRGDVWGRSEDPHEQYRRMQERLENTLLFPSESPVGLDTAYHRAGMELFSYAYAEEPELVSAWLEALNLHEVERVKRCANAELAPLALVYSDLAIKHGTMFSPAFLRKEFFPRLARLVAAWHDAGVKVIFHSDGDFTAVMDDFVAAGVDGVNPLEKMAGFDHVARVRENWPEQTMMGGIDCSNLLPFASTDEVKAEVRRTLDIVKPGGRFILGSTTELHPACNLDNILAMWDAALAYGRFE